MDNLLLTTLSVIYVFALLASYWLLHAGKPVLASWAAMVAICVLPATGFLLALGLVDSDAALSAIACLLTASPVAVDARMQAEDAIVRELARRACRNRTARNVAVYARRRRWLAKRDGGPLAGLCRLYARAARDLVTGRFADL